MLDGLECALAQRRESIAKKVFKFMILIRSHFLSRAFFMDVKKKKKILELSSILKEIFHKTLNKLRAR